MSIEILDGLNPDQEEAVLHNSGPLLVVAGAGSGKTRVLTHRIARLIQEEGVSPFAILAITFTNKAATEMRSRVEGLVGPVAQRMWVSTFHSACVRILRREAKAIGYPSSFTIYDHADAVRLTSYVLRDSEHRLQTQSATFGALVDQRGEERGPAPQPNSWRLLIPPMNVVSARYSSSTSAGSRLPAPWISMTC